MKKILWYAIALLGMAALASCEKDQPKEPEASLQIETPTVAFATEEAGEQEATFVVNKAWTATPSAEWIKVTPASGEAGTITVKIAVEANTGEARGGTVTINVEKITKDNVINVTQGAYIPPKTIKEFATEYVKIIDIWEATVGPMKMHSTVDAVENAHYIPETTTIKVGDKTYNTADMLETALRSYLLIRGYDGLDTEHYGAGSIAALADGAVGMAATPVPDTHEYEWGADSPFNETSGNGGHLNMIVDGKNVHSQVRVDILDNWAQRALNFQKGKTISNMCTYPRDPINDYTGSFCSQRALLTYAFFFKYMLDNNLDKGTEVANDVIIRSELFGDEAVAGTIADFAAEYVKIIDLWKKNVGDKKMHSSVDATKNAHFVPEDATITVGDYTYNTADMLELALRSYLLIRGYDGLDTENYGAGKIAALDSALSMSATPLPKTHGYEWGADSPFNETSGNGGNLCMVGADNRKTYNQVKVDILDNWAQRATNYQHGKTISNLCGYSSNQLAGYYGCFCSQRALMTYAYFFKYMIDNKLEKGTDVPADQTIRSELFGTDGKKLAQWNVSAAAAENTYGKTFGGESSYDTNGKWNGNAYLYNPAAGDCDQYVDANWSGNGRLTYVQIDKTGMEANTNAGHDVGSTGHIIVKAPWTGDYWLFQATSETELPAGTKIHVFYIFRSSASGAGYFLVEYNDGTEWKTAPLRVATEADEGYVFSTTQTKTKKTKADIAPWNAKSKENGSSNTWVDFDYTLAAPMTTVQVRQTVVATNRADNDNTLSKLNSGTTRIAGSEPNSNGMWSSPVIEIIEYK
ncbi:MAG: BACON domain-containing protein [Bacteroidales bacterium]|nr:BACON domain-containing protein [Bacteroidales bacterium]